MLNLQKCLMSKTRDLPLVPGTSIKEEGIPLVRILVDGKEHVQPYTGVAAGNKFLGFSYAETMTANTLSAVEKLEVASDWTVKLNHEPITGQFSCLKADGTLISGTLVKDVITLPDNTTGKIKVSYRYVPTLDELLQSTRLQIPYMTGSDIVGSIGVIYEGEVYTNQFDASVNFADPTLSLGVTSAGVIGASTGTNALAITNADITFVPTADCPFLGLRLKS